MRHVSKIIKYSIFLVMYVNSYKVIVKVDQGKVIGIKGTTVFGEKHYYAFYGVPYAKPPTGTLRFKDPRPDVKWQRPLDARTEYHGACAQQHILYSDATYGVEDCLYMNIYTPSLLRSETDNLKAVIVWVHGYAFTSSLSHIQGADFFIDNEVLFISLSHRLGAFGFLKLDKTASKGNMGLKDIIMGLKWIQKNVKQFGGDKRKITVMGSGSGATLLSLLLMTDNRKLFSKMILQSGSIFSPVPFFTNPMYESKRLQEVLNDGGINKLKKANIQDFITASHKIYSTIQKINHQRPLIPFTPIVEKESSTSVIIQRPDDFYAKHNNLNISIPILIGFNSQESISEIIPFLKNPRYLKSYTPYLKYMVPFSDGCSFNYTSKEYNDITDKIKREYFKDGISESSLRQFLKYTSDLIKYPIYKFIKTHLKIFNSPMFVYKFDYVGKFNTAKTTSTADAKVKIAGASAGDEICYIMKCEPVWESYVKIKNDTKDRDRKFIEKMSEMWANFAKYGNPTESLSGVQWLPMTSHVGYNLYYIGENNKMVYSKNDERMFSFWNDIMYDNYYSEKKFTNNNKIHNEL